MPPKTRVVDVSACWNGAKSDSASTSVPLPVSWTSVTSTHPSPVLAARTWTSTVPSWVNFTAFETRFDNTWDNRVGSPLTTSGTSSP